MSIAVTSNLNVVVAALAPRYTSLANTYCNQKSGVAVSVGLTVKLLPKYKIYTLLADPATLLCRK